MYILGLDSGATNTTALLVNEELNILGHAESGPGNYYIAGKKSAEQNIKEAINKSIEKSGINRSDKIHAGLGIGNIDTDHDYEIVSEFIGGLHFVNNKKIVNDSKVAHYALTAGNAGISIVAGTGAIAYGDDGTSESRANGWGWLIGDRGSAFYTARQGLQKAAMAYDGRRPDTILIDRAISHFDLDGFPEIMQCVHEYIDHPKKISSFSKCVTQAAELGDPAAKQIVQNLSKELAISVEAVNSDLNIEKPIKIGCTGGLFSSDIVLESVDEQIKRRIPCSNLLPPIMNPVVGGIAVAISDSKICITRNKLRELDSRLGKNK